MPPFSRPQVTIESDSPVPGTRNRMAAIRVRGIGTDPGRINRISSTLMGLRYGATITATPTESTGGSGYFVLHYQGEPLTAEEVARAVR